MHGRSAILVLASAGCAFTARAVPDADPPDGPAVSPDAPAAAKPWFDLAWSRRNAIEIHTQRLNAALGGYPLAGFPVLVELPATFDHAHVAAGGADLRFVLEDQATVVPYEIETYDATGTSLLWVRVPSIAPAAGNPRLWLYHGNPSAPAASNGAAVFAAEHVSVHHLGPNYLDVTGHGHDGVPSNDQPDTVSAGAIGEARNFDGAAESITLNGEAAYDFTTSLSVSAWINVSTFDVAYQALVCKGDDTWRIHRENATDAIGFGTNGPTSDNTAGTVNVKTGGWRHVAIVYTGAEKQVYVDGVLDRGEPYAKALSTDNTPVSFGLNATATTGGRRLWRGGIDEVRISQQPRSPAWISAEHATAVDHQLVTIGADETR